MNRRSFLSLVGVGVACPSFALLEPVPTSQSKIDKYLLDSFRNVLQHTNWRTPISGRGATYCQHRRRWIDVDWKMTDKEIILKLCL